MSEQDNHINELFEKAKKSPPVVSLSEVKDMLKDPAVRKNRSSKRWVYFSLSCFVALALFTWYKYSGEKGRAKRLPHFVFNTSSLPPTQANEQMSIEDESNVVKRNAGSDKDGKVALLPVSQPASALPT